jgi:ribosomal protein S18 acetylase RimI-like enzyme
MNTRETAILRREEINDEPFLFQVYAHTRVEELALTNWDPATRQAFLTMQFQAMRRGYRDMFPTGDFSIIELAGQPAGRMIVDRGPAAFRVVDIALLPEYQNRGIGTFLMQRICSEAAAHGQVVRLSVLKNSRAVRWYDQLGFRKIADAGVYDEMEWRAAG